MVERPGQKMIGLNDVTDFTFARLVKAMDDAGFIKSNTEEEKDRMPPVTLMLTIGEDGTNIFDTFAVERLGVNFEKILRESNSRTKHVCCIDVEGPFQIKNPQVISSQITSKTHAAWKIVYQLSK